MKNTFLILSFFLQLFIFYPAQAQVPVEKSTEIQIVDGKTFYIHEVKSGQTLYSISRAYQVTVDEIKAANHLTDNTLKTGYLLRIPGAITNNAESVVLESDAGRMELSDHTIKSGETLYGIAQTYGTTPDNLKKLNPGMGDNIVPGQIIKVPVQAKPVVVDKSIKHTVVAGETLFGIAKKYTKTVKQLKSLNPGLTESISVGQTLIVGFTDDSTVTQKQELNFNCSDAKKQNVYNVALLIPLQQDRAVYKDFDKDNHDDNEYYENPAFQFIQFYEGLTLALDTLKRSGVNVNLYVFDLDESEAKFDKVFSNPVMKDMHLIIGPFYGKFIDRISQFSYENKIPMANCFLSGQIELNEMNPYFFNPVTSVEYQMKGLAAYYKTEKPDANVIIAYESSGMEKIAATELDSALKAIGYPSWSMVNLSESGLKGATSRFVGGKRENILVMLTNGEMRVGNYIRSLNDYKEKYEITLFGLPGWLDYELIDFEFLEFQHTHFFSSSFIDFERIEVRNFAKKFQHRYKVDPTKQAYAGYDIGLYFISALEKYGTGFPGCIKEHKPNLLSTEMDFVFSPVDGFRNHHVSIYRMKDFQLWKVR